MDHDDHLEGTGDRPVQVPGGLDLARLAHTEADLLDVEHALERLDAGTWSTCEACGAALDLDLLRSHPAARTCGAAHRPESELTGLGGAGPQS